MKRACAALPGSRAGYYRRQTGKASPAAPTPIAPAPKPSPRALSQEEQARLLEARRSERFQDQAPREVYATLLSEGQYLGSISTMYRLLRRHGEVKERRDQLRHVSFSRPELLARGPNQLWSWDITKLKLASKWTYAYLYVVLDVYSRYVVGWCVAPCESSEVAEQLILRACLEQQIERGALTLHADRGTAMTSKVVEQLLTDLGVSKTHSRPHVSNDNPYSEAQFKTLRYRPSFPDRFQSLVEAEAFCTEFFAWYNQEHAHSGIADLTPRIVHEGRANEEIARRQAVLEAAYAAHPQRFVNRGPKHPPLPEAVWINPPAAAGTDPEVAASGAAK